MQLAIQVLIFSCWTFLAHCNVEKSIFSAPEVLVIPRLQPSFDQLRLETLTPSKSTLRRQLRAAFPTSTDPQGPASWFLLDSLSANCRYELRVCWLATVRPTLPNDTATSVQQFRQLLTLFQQPTDFTINTFEVSEVFNNPALLSSLSHFSEDVQSVPPPESSFDSNKERQTKTSLLFLKVNAKADYFTSNTSLLRNVPSVAVDLSTSHSRSDDPKA